MSEVEITKISSKGQVVIPKSLRDEFGIKPGESFAVYGGRDTIILKKIQVPTSLEAFEALVDWSVKFAKKKGIKEEDVERIIHRRRGVEE
ncbi:MAG: AbrB/MazE/SpoVT family DNA-binding domain-containing protein [Candidatus Hydrothermarchaeales archaeon]